MAGISSRAFSFAVETARLFVPDPVLLKLRRRLLRVYRALRFVFDKLVLGRSLVSVVVPVYNVEKYVLDCLTSILAQTYPHIEIVVIVDGSTDSSEAIVRRVAARDRRVRVITQPNAGLSAARNRGVEEARGKYLWFVDADDVITPTAVASMLRSLVRSRSDFVVCSYYRFNSKRQWNPGSWIRKAHAKTRRRVKLDDYPAILVSAIACNKLYRRDFWSRAGLSFPVGCIYEDQEVSTAAYAKASSFDVLAGKLYGWRAREDTSSISQQTYSLRDISERLRAISTSIAILEEQGHPAAARARLLQFLNNDFRHSAPHLVDCDEDYWRTFRQGLVELTRGMELTDWAEVHPRFGILEWLLIHDRRTDAQQYIAEGWLTRQDMQLGWGAGRRTCRVPIAQPEGAAVPDEVLAVPPAEIALRYSLLGASWDEARQALVVAAWAYSEGFDTPDMAATVGVSLVKRGHRMPLVVEDSRTGLVATIPDKSFGNQGQLFSFLVFPDKMPAGPGSHTYGVEVSLDGHTVGFGYLPAMPNPEIPVSWPGVGVSSSGTRVRLLQSPGRRLRVHLDRPAYRIAGWLADGGSLPVVCTKPGVMPPIRLRFRPAGTPHRPVVSVRLKKLSPRTWSFAWPKPHPDWVGEGPLAVRAIHALGRRRKVTWADAPDSGVRHLEGTGLVLLRDSRGRLAVDVVGGNGVLMLDQVKCGPRVLSLRGRAAGRARPDSLMLATHRVRLRTGLLWEEDRWRADVPLEVAVWGRATLPLESGKYGVFAADAGTPGSESPLPPGNDLRDVGGDPVILGSSIADAKRLVLEPELVRARLEVAALQPVQFTIDPPLAPDERGKRNQAEWQHKIPLLRTNSMRENVILLRSYYGEVANCNPYGIHQAIRRAGADLTVLWGVRDYSVPLPEGGVPVVIGSRAWYEALATAKYQVHNVHQPAYFRKGPGQVMVQTMHGYPFKMAGVPYWTRAGLSKSKIHSFMARQAEWDVFVSPAPYATPLLEMTFPGAARMLEIGYPRNDIFFAPDRDEIRESTRELLGLPDHVTAVMYAPTFRDKFSDKETKARFARLLDPVTLAEALGEDYRVLMRGHPMEGRGDDRREAAQWVIDVTDYPIVEELCLASDVGVMDYSSLRFDYGLTGKPMVFFVPDLEEYMSDERGSLIPYEGTAPGPWVRTQEDLADVLLDLPGLTEHYGDARVEFARDFLSLEDGKAGDRLLKALLDI